MYDYNKSQILTVDKISSLCLSSSSVQHVDRYCNKLVVGGVVISTNLVKISLKVHVGSRSCDSHVRSTPYIKVKIIIK